MSNTRSALRGSPRAKPNDRTESVVMPSPSPEKVVRTCWASSFDGKAGGVDQPVRPAAERREQLAFARDPVGHRPVLRERMPPPRLRIAPRQLLAAALEEQRSDIVAVVLAKPLDAADDALGVESAGLRADPDRQRPLVGGIGALGQVGVEQAVEEEEGKVVDRLPAEILERAQHGGLARARHAGDEQDVLGHRSCSCRAPLEREFDLDRRRRFESGEREHGHVDPGDPALAAVLGEARRRVEDRRSAARPACRWHSPSRRYRARAPRSCPRWSAVGSPSARRHGGGRSSGRRRRAGRRDRSVGARDRTCPRPIGPRSAPRVRRSPRTRHGSSPTKAQGLGVVINALRPAEAVPRTARRSTGPRAIPRRCCPGALRRSCARWQGPAPNAGRTPRSRAAPNGNGETPIRATHRERRGLRPRPARLDRLPSTPADMVISPSFGREGNRVLDEILEHALQPRALAERDQPVLRPPVECDADSAAASRAPPAERAAPAIIAPRSTGSKVARLSWASSRDASEMSLISRSSRWTSSRTISSSWSRSSGSCGRGRAPRPPSAARRAGS